MSGRHKCYRYKITVKGCARACDVSYDTDLEHTLSPTEL